MKPQPGYYSLIQYCPDAARSEAVNVGVALLCPGLNYLDAALTDNPKRAVKLFGRNAVQPKALQAAKQAIRVRLTKGDDRPTTLAEFQKFIDTRANDIVLTDPRPVKLFREAPIELESLFLQLVETPTIRRTRRAPLARELDKLFRMLVREGRAQSHPTIVVPITGKELRIPYAYQNGTLNLVKPQRFSTYENAASDVAMKLAVEGDLIARHGADHDEVSKQLIVVASFGGDKADKPIRNCIREILGEYHVRAVLPEDVHDFADQVRAEAHPI